MAAPAGNKFWEARSTHGREKIFSSAQALEDACKEYFQWNSDNPLQAGELVKFMGSAQVEYTPKMRVMSISALSRFLGISEQTWRNYREQEDLFEVISWAEGIIRDQMIEGSSAGMLNANIISRLLGLGDNRSVDVTSGGKAITSPSIIVLEAASDDDSED